MPDNSIKLKQIDQELTTFVNGLVNQNFTGFINAFINSGYFGTTVVYASGGDQSVFGLKTFITSPQIPYSGSADQAISMQFLLDRLSGSLNNVVYTTGNQIISSVKYFSDLTCAFPTGGPSVVNVAYFNSRGVIFNTGTQTLQGATFFGSGVYGTATPSGSTHFIRYLELTNASGALVSQIAAIDPSTLSGFLEAKIVASGNLLNGRINTVSGQLVTSGATLQNRITGLSGRLNNTGTWFQNQLNFITGTAIPVGGISGQVLTKTGAGNYQTAWQTLPTVGGGGGGGGNVSVHSGNPNFFSYDYDGDASGVFYWLGTNYGSGAWTNPYLAGKLDIFSTDNVPFTDNKETMVDRTASAYSTDSTLNTIVFGFKNGYSLIPSFYSYRYRNDANTFSPTGWQIRGSNDQSNWTVVHNLVSGIAPLEVSASKWISRPIFNATTGYKYIEFLMSGNNNSANTFMSIGEFELYGELIQNVSGSLNRIALFENPTTLGLGPTLLSNSSYLSFPNTSGFASSDLTLPITGATVNDTVMLGVHPNATLPNSLYSAWISANDQATIRFSNTSGDPQSPSQGKFSLTVFHDPLIPEAFSPLDLPGLKLWLKADGLSYNDGDEISSWTDYSTTSNTATQGTSINRPIFKTGILNGLPIARFDGADDHLSFPNDPGDTTTTIVVAALNADASSQIDYSAFVITASANGLRLLAKVNTTNNWGSFTSTPLPAGEDLLSGQFNILGMTTKSDSTVLYRNGVVKNSNTLQSAGAGAGGNIVGAEIGSSRYVNADIAEILIYNNIITGSNRFLLENYLSTKYNIH